MTPILMKILTLVLNIAVLGAIAAFAYWVIEKIPSTNGILSWLKIALYVVIAIFIIIALFALLPVRF